ncbi:MAG: PD40 domain-containing protein [Bacteroidia bacterium]|nr:PD40 domain-containing protein [Bacteroidia bacterium]
MNLLCFSNKEILSNNIPIKTGSKKTNSTIVNRIVFFSFSFMLLLISLESSSQIFGKNKLFNKKLETANLEFSYNNFHLALPIYNELHAMDSANTEVCYKLAACLFKVRRQTLESLPLFEKSKNDYSEAHYYLGQIYHRKMMFDKALEEYMEFKNNGEKPEISLDEVDYLMQKSVVAKEMILTKANASVTNFNNGINTPYAEYVPLLNPDETKLFFTSRRKGSTGDLLDPYYEYFEDIYVSEKSGTTWDTPVNISTPLNSETHDACVTLSKDGQQLYIYRTSKDQATGHIYVSQNNEGKWSEPKFFDAHINSENSAESSISISPDLATIYFSSNRPGGYGGKDIYRVTKMPDSTWSRPLNLGPTINTPYDEDAPFIHPDGISLYFSSKGHRNMGGYDIFKTTKNDNGQWSAAENLGFPVNSVMDDIYFIATFDGRQVYFSSNRDEGKGNMDIYKGEIIDPQTSQIILKGTVTTNEPEFMPVRATITIIDFDTKALQGIYRTSKNGKYILVVLPRKKYKVLIESDGYYPYSTEIDMTTKLSLDDLFKTISLKKIN